MQLKELFQAMRDKGVKLTNQRRELVQILLENRRPISAEDIFLKLKKQNPEVCLATIYRNLDLLVNLDLVRQLQLSGTRREYELVGDDHYHYLVCLGCNETRRLENCPIEEYQRQVMEETDYTVTEHRFAMYGYCPACRGEGEDEGKQRERVG